MLYLMQESPRWLLATGKTDRALKGITRVARANGKPDSIVKDMDIVIIKDKKTGMVKKLNLQFRSYFRNK